MIDPSELESPLMAEDLFAGEGELKREGLLASLEAESPFQNAFEYDQIPPAPPQARCGFPGPNGVIVEEKGLGSAIANAALSERRRWFDSRGKTLQREDNDSRFIDLVRYWLAVPVELRKGVRVQIQPGIFEALQKAALDPGITYGNLSDDDLNTAMKDFAVAEKKVNDIVEEVYKQSYNGDSARLKLKSLQKAAKTAETVMKDARRRVKQAEDRVKAARGQSLSATQAMLSRELVALGAATTALRAAQKDRDAKTRELNDAIKATIKLKEKVKEATNARDTLMPKSDWKIRERMKVRDALLTKAAAKDPAKISGIIDNALFEAHKSRADIVAWSAVFVAWCIRKAAIDLGLEATDSRGAHAGKDGLLKSSIRHAEYIVEARDRKRRLKGTYQAFEPRDRAVQIGDLICTDRTNFIDKPVSLKELKVGRNLHCDIVTMINSLNGKPAWAETIGGNVLHSVRRRRYPLDSQGLLIRQNALLYAQEEDDGKFLPFETIDPVPSMLRPKSTGRIFALLSPVCRPA